MKVNKLRLTGLSIMTLVHMSCSTAPITAEGNAGVPVVYSPKYKISVFGLERFHPFDIAKYDKIYKGLKNDGLVNDETLTDPDPLTNDELLLVHTVKYLESLRTTQNVAHYLEAPPLRLIPNSMIERMVVSRFKKSSGGTLTAARKALSSPKKIAFNLGGGFHHAKPDKGEGFCIIADVPVAIRVLQRENLIERALIIDTDIHQGNGTIVSLPNDPTTYTFSMHEGGIYPIPKEKGDEDIELPSGITDSAYLKILAARLDDLFSKSQPDIVFHVAGCDALSGDPLANGQMTHNGIAQRDAMILAACKKRNIPYVMTLSGGYSKDAWNAQYKSIKAILSAEAD